MSFSTHYRLYNNFSSFIVGRRPWNNSDNIESKISAFELSATHELQGPEFEDNLLQFATTTQSLRRHISRHLLAEDRRISGHDKHLRTREKRFAAGLRVRTRARARVPAVKRKSGAYDHRHFFGKAGQQARPKTGGSLPRHPILRQRPRSAVVRRPRRTTQRGGAQFTPDHAVRGARSEFREATP